MTGIHARPVDIKTILPAEIHGWKAVEDQEFDPDTIFDYIDGAGEVYRAYGFVRLFGRRYENPDGPAIIADVFDMGSSRNAFGVFTHDLEGREAGIGQGSRYKGGFLTFWKGPVYVTVFAESDTPASEKAVLALGERAATAVGETGDRPAVLDLLPEDNLREGTARFLFHPVILNYHYFVADDNILRIDDRTDVVLASYGETDPPARLLIVRYPDEPGAARADESFRQGYMPDAADEGRVRTENGLWTAVSRAGDLVAVVFDAPSAAGAESLIRAVFERREKGDVS